MIQSHLGVATATDGIQLPVRSKANDDATFLKNTADRLDAVIDRILGHETPKPIQPVVSEQSVGLEPAMDRIHEQAMRLSNLVEAIDNRIG